ncbi:MAG: TlpA disulfide reductase family protein [Candidatus Poribacteria bacterium]|nr:TlpA disulfide reductase family protein [Candidatus Poribacteria bacterium]
MMRTIAALFLASAALVNLHAASHGDHAEEAFQQLKKTNDAYAAIDNGSFAWEKTISFSTPQGDRLIEPLSQTDTLEILDGNLARSATSMPHPTIPTLLGAVLINNGSVWVASPGFAEIMEIDSAQVRTGFAAYTFADENGGFSTRGFPESAHSIDEIAALELLPDEMLDLNGTEKTYKKLKVSLKPGAHEKAQEKTFQEKVGELGILHAFLALDLYELGMLRVQIDGPPMEATLWIDPETNLIAKQTFDAPAKASGQEMSFTYTIVQTRALLNDEPPAERFAPNPKWAVVDTFGKRKPEIGKQAFDFTLKDLSGKETTISDLKGNVVVLDFWATWCGPCVQAMPHLQELHDEYKDDGLLIYGVNKEDPGEPAKFFEEGGYTFPTFINATTAFVRYHVGPIPTTYVIGRDGNIEAEIVGYGGEEDKRLETALKKALAKGSEEAQ